jgi:hypothetical protein
MLTIMGSLLFFTEFLLKLTRFFNKRAKYPGHGLVVEWTSVALLGALHYLKLALRVTKRRSARTLKRGNFAGHLRPQADHAKQFGVYAVNLRPPFFDGHDEFSS